MKKINLIFLIIGVLTLSGYVIVRYNLRTPGFVSTSAKDPSASTKPGETSLDLRPALITKLQQLVKQGSDGLYNLSIHEIEPDLLSSSVLLKKLELRPDSLAWKSLRDQGNEPSDVFTIVLDSLKIDGIGIKDLVNKDAMNLNSITISSPHIEVYHNKNAPSKKDQGTLYEKISRQLRHFSVDKIRILDASLVSHQTKKTDAMRIRELTIELGDLLFDSTTQNDKSRFLYSKQALISGKNFSIPSGDRLYNFKIGSFTLSATDQVFTARNVLLQPQYSKKDFQKKVHRQLERYDLAFDHVQLKGIEWWRLFNGESLEASSAQINGASAEIYLDRSLPQSPPKIHNFPHQLLMQLQFPIHIPEISMNGASLLYQEFDPPSGKTASMKINSLHGKILNLTNMPSVIRSHPEATVVATGTFLNGIETNLRLGLNLANWKQGAFTAHLSTKEFDGTIVNPLAEASGLFMIKRGMVQSMSADVSGNNAQASGKVLLLYTGLHVTPLEKDKNDPGKLDKKNITSLLANKLLIKDNNPSGNSAPRNPDCSFTRDPHGSFFNLIWKTSFVGILKTIGAPEKLAK
ncbi:MAG: hypothetical protein ACJ75B_00640 [Flavisolibacter sp.]